MEKQKVAFDEAPFTQECVSMGLVQFADGVAFIASAKQKREMIRRAPENLGVLQVTPADSESDRIDEARERAAVRVAARLAGVWPDRSNLEIQVTASSFVDDVFDSLVALHILSEPEEIL